MDAAQPATIGIDRQGTPRGNIAARHEFAALALVSAIPLLWLGGRTARRRYALGFLAGVAPYLPHAAIVGPSGLLRNFHDLIDSVPGRKLPVPFLSTDSGELLVAYMAAVVALSMVGAALVATRNGGVEGPLLLSVALFSAGLLPYVLSRPDVPHILPSAFVPVSLLPVLGVVAARTWGRRRTVELTLVLAIIAGVLGFLAPEVVRVPAEEQLGLAIRGDGRTAFEVEHAGRSFRLASEDAARHASVVLSRLDEFAAPGDTVFVGPRDLRRAIYNDTWLYFLLPELVPATFYLEFNPGGANGEDSGLAEELASADFVILTNRWEGWIEPNESRRLGPDEPNTVVASLFCAEAETASFALYRRCR